MEKYLLNPLGTCDLLRHFFPPRLVVQEASAEVMAKIARRTNLNILLSNEWIGTGLLSRLILYAHNSASTLFALRKNSITNFYLFSDVARP